ncbi:Parvalbumin [Parasponia andersonii]|uniref:Parvalbumin n=1 Tax=Parasponia andersonii TaxID=3476 RepID=A0A2P5AIW7_PARAD|nr:Parvalbumin [Parasponia andersonii]
MATAIVSDSKPHKWFSPNNFKLKLPRLAPKSKPKSQSQSQSRTLITPSPAKTTGLKREEYEQVFRHFDSNADGKISSEELRAYFTSIEESMSPEEARTVVREFDNNGDDLLDFGEFVRLIERDGGEGDDDLKMAFEMFELDKGCGHITPKGLQRMLNRLGDAKSYQECVSMIRVFDLDGNGVLDFDEFLHMMTSN